MLDVWWNIYDTHVDTYNPKKISSFYGSESQINNICDNLNRNSTGTRIIYFALEQREGI